MDQKANSVADIAAVLKGQEGELEKALNQKEALGVKGIKVPTPKRGAVRKAQQLEAKIQQLESVRKEPVRIRWANILDAEYAESWPESVIHDGLGSTRHTAPHPEPVEKVAELKPEVVL